MKKGSKGLGRGLGALLGDDMAAIIDSEQQVVAEIPIEDIDPNREQPRRHFDKDDLEQLADSIRSVGLIQPILVSRSGERYSIIAGERRWRAARIAELERIPAIVRDMDKVLRMEVALIENLQREDLNPIDQAIAVKALMEECGLNQEGVARRLGKSRPAIANLLRLLQLDDEVQEYVIEKKLSAGHARALSALHDNPTAQKELAEHAIVRGWSVRQIEQEVARAQNPKPALEKPARSTAEGSVAELSALEDIAREAFGVRAKTSGNLDKGALTLHFNSREDLDSIYALIEFLITRSK